MRHTGVYRTCVRVWQEMLAVASRSCVRPRPVRRHAHRHTGGSDSVALDARVLVARCSSSPRTRCICRPMSSSAGSRFTSSPMRRRTPVRIPSDAEACIFLSRIGSTGTSVGRGEEDPAHIGSKPRWKGIISYLSFRASWKDAMTGYVPPPRSALCRSISVNLGWELVRLAMHSDCPYSHTVRILLSE